MNPFKISQGRLLCLLCSVVALSYPIHSETQVVNITQTPCKFDEMDTGNKSFVKPNFSECEKWNADSKSAGSRKLKPLKLKPGKYSFRVTNVGVPYEVGFYLRGAGIGRFYLPEVSGGEIFDGVTKEYSVQLVRGRYKLSCPLNPTPDYELIVE